MGTKLGPLALGVTLLALAAPSAQADCTLVKVFELPVTISNQRALVSVKLNGSDVTFIVDSGSAFSMLSPAAVAKLGLRASPFASDIVTSGLGGDTRSFFTTRAKELSFAGHTLRDPEFAVSETDLDEGVAGLLGQNLLANLDVEYDLGHGVIRAMRSVGCGGAPLAYWAGGGSQDYSVVDIDSISYQAQDPTVVGYAGQSMPRPHIGVHATLNGVRIKVELDTGSPRSLISLAAAGAAGVKTTDPDVVPSDPVSGVAKRSQTKAWRGHFASFKLGDEDIKNVHILMASDERGVSYDMLLGMDFFLSHHIYVSNRQHKMYFTYAGGKVFDVDTSAASPAAGLGPDTSKR